MRDQGLDLAKLILERKTYPSIFEEGSSVMNNWLKNHSGRGGNGAWSVHNISIHRFCSK